MMSPKHALSVVPAVFLLVAAAPEPVRGEIPYFARVHGVECSTCHVQPPRLNEFGEAFRRGGYRMPDGQPARSFPFAIWASVRSDAFPDENEVRSAVRAYVNKLEVISGGPLGGDWLSYFVEWRPVSLEPTTREGVVGLRDRSGRFEDIFVTASAGALSLTVGQFRQIDQVDVSLRLGLSEPLPLSASVAGSGEGSSRQRSLRGFSPAGRSPSARIAVTRPVSGGWAWTASAALPLPGEFSLPLTREAREEASNEIEWRAKGIVAEGFLARDLFSFGTHLFYDDRDRYLAQGVTTGRYSNFLWTAVGGVEHRSGTTRGRWSLEGEVVPSYYVALGGRVEDRAGDGVPRAFLPYVRAQFPGTRYTAYVAIEQRVQSDRNATLIEIGTVF